MALLAVIGLAVLGSFAYGGLRGAPWVPTRRADLERFTHLARIRPGQVVYDLGCGDGRLICAAAAHGAIAYGFEVSLVPYVLAHFRRLASPHRQNIHIRYRDFWLMSLRPADLVYCFLMPEKYPALEEKFRQELRPGARVITYVWPLQSWEPRKISRHPAAATLYLYQR